MPLFSVRWIQGKPGGVINVQQTTNVDYLANTLQRRNPPIIESGENPWHDLCFPFDASADERMHDCPLWKDTRRPGEPIVPDGLFEKDYLVNAKQGSVTIIFRPSGLESLLTESLAIKENMA